MNLVHCPWTFHWTARLDYIVFSLQWYHWAYSLLFLHHSQLECIFLLLCQIFLVRLWEHRRMRHIQILEDGLPSASLHATLRRVFSLLLPLYGNDSSDIQQLILPQPSSAMKDLHPGAWILLIWPESYWASRPHCFVLVFWEPFSHVGFLHLSDIIKLVQGVFSTIVNPEGFQLSFTLPFNECLPLKKIIEYLILGFKDVLPHASLLSSV